MASPAAIFQLSGTCNNYPWGRKGTDSLAAKLCQRTPGTGFSLKGDEYYSEMWFGDYPDFPGRDLKSGKMLGDVIKENPQELLGEDTIKKFGGNLPFLPKILSIGSALPLQIHPNKTLARELHRKDPESYSDDNHKPEIAIALSKFELFVGWKPKDRIAALFQLEPLRRFAPDAKSQWTDETLRSVTRQILSASEEEVSSIQNALGQSSSELEKLGQGHVAQLLPRLQDQQSSKDPGILVALLCMNYLVLQPGEGVYVPADGIHAYLAGNLVECMARSNNMLTGGLCPVMDRNSVDLFVDTLKFSEETKGDNVRLPPRPTRDGQKGHTQVYSPPLSEFDMLNVNLAKGQEERLAGQKGPLVAIVVSGSGRVSAGNTELAAEEGFIFYVSPGTQTAWVADGGLQVYAAVVRPVS